ncbi:MAG TPA: aquaporin [Gemmatimonadaceae bacterium]|jgi:MIP family channel proteins|nr:aquaporin [Gemmatimonadaceae bacterium]
MRDPVRHFTAEFIGTFALVFVGSGILILGAAPGNHIGLLDVALAHGLIFAIMVTATMRISGHLNPAVTFGFLVTKRIEPVMAGVYIVAQLLGAIIAAYVLQWLFPPALYAAAHGGALSISLNISSGQAYLLEGIATFFLVFVVFATVVDPRAPHVGGFAIGLTIAADILAIGPLTGASMNPARSFGPAVATGSFEGQVIYWVGPILGGIAAALLYEWLLIHHPTEPEYHGTAAPVG